MPVLERWKLQWESSSPKRQAAQHSEQTLKTALNSKHPAHVSQNETQQHLMEDFQTDNGLFGPVILHLRQIGSPPISGLPKTLNTFSEILTERHLLLRNAVWWHSAMDLLGNTRIISEEFIKWLKGYFEPFCYGYIVKLPELVLISVTECSFSAMRTHKTRSSCRTHPEVLKREGTWRCLLCCESNSDQSLFKRLLAFCLWTGLFDSWYGQALPGMAVILYLYEGKVKKLQKITFQGAFWFLITITLLEWCFAATIL